VSAENPTLAADELVLLTVPGVTLAAWSTRSSCSECCCWRRQCWSPGCWCTGRGEAPVHLRGVPARPGAQFAGQQGDREREGAGTTGAATAGDAGRVQPPGRHGSSARRWTSWSSTGWMRTTCAASSSSRSRPAKAACRPVSGASGTRSRQASWSSAPSRWPQVPLDDQLVATADDKDAVRSSGWMTWSRTPMAGTSQSAEQDHRHGGRVAVRQAIPVRYPHDGRGPDQADRRTPAVHRAGRRWLGRGR
jgi:hypothetical protein